MNFEVSTNEGSYDLTAGVRLIGDDVLVAIWGGDKPHIGAVAVAQCHPRLKDPNALEATASVICLLGHKESELAKKSAESLAVALDRSVVVTAGMHWDSLPKEDHPRIERNCETLVESVLRRILECS